MKNFRNLGLITTLLLLTPHLYPYELKDVLSRIEKKEEVVKIISFKFTQQIHFTDMDISSLVNGEAIYQKPNKLNIKKFEPQEQITISNGKKIWVYTPSFKQVWVGKAKDWEHSKLLSEGMMPLNNYAEGLKKNFNLSLTGPDQNNQISILAKPKNPDLGYALTLDISTENWLPIRTEYVSDSAVVVTHIKEIKVNPSVGPDKFSFEPPSGIDIIPLN